MFKIELIHDHSKKNYTESSSLNLFHYDEDLDNHISVLSDICVILEQSGVVKFLVSGFGQRPWPVDVRTDLAILLEQLPELAKFVNSQQLDVCNICFYEQGIERDLRFTMRGQNVDILCSSRSNWRPYPSIETISLDKLRAMIAKFVETMFEAIKSTCPSVFAAKLFADYAHHLTQTMGLGVTQNFFDDC